MVMRKWLTVNESYWTYKLNHAMQHGGVCVDWKTFTVTQTPSNQIEKVPPPTLSRSVTAVRGPQTVS